VAIIWRNWLGKLGILHSCRVSWVISLALGNLLNSEQPRSDLMND